MDIDRRQILAGIAASTAVAGIPAQAVASSPVRELTLEIIGRIRADGCASMILEDGGGLIFWEQVTGDLSTLRVMPHDPEP